MAPETPRPGAVWRARATAIVLALAVTALAGLAPPADAFKVTTWNLWQYPGSALSTRQPLFRTVMQHLDTDAIVVQELETAAGADSFLINVLRVAAPHRVWKKGGFLDNETINTESTIFYDSLTVAAINNEAALVTGGPREVYQVVLTPRGYAAAAARLRVYSLHLKAGNTAADTAMRRTECTSLRNTLNTQAAVIPNILIGGDFNFYGAWEGGYQVLLADQIDDDGRVRDHVSLPGTWNQSGYACYHSQSPCLSGCIGGQSGGGLDDRFDFWLMSYPMFDGEGVDHVSTVPYGNDCNHYNSDINSPANSAVPSSVANALKTASDHLPVIVTIQLPAKLLASSAVHFGNAIVGAGTVNANLSVSNGGTLLPVDELNYSMIAPAGFTAPGGGFTHSAGGAPNVHALGMLASSVGAKSGTLVMNTDDPDSLAKNVALTGTVLDHAAASLDSLESVPSDTVDFGIRVQGDFNDQPVRVHNLEYDALQARLSVTGASITGGGGRFSIVGGFTPGLVADVARTLTIHFDDTGAALDQVYEATLTITSADEPLPGATAQPALTVLLRAQPKSVTGAEDALPRVVSFLPARPNPMAGETMLAFELPRAANARLEVFDLGGRHVATLAEGAFAPGRHAVRWNATASSGARVEAGLYFARFSTAGYARVQRLVVLP